MALSTNATVDKVETDLAQSTSPLPTDHPHNIDIPQSPLKRKSSPNAWEENDEKRQKTGPSEVTGIVEDDFLKNLLAEASAAATESYQKSTHDDNIVHIKSELAMTDGNAYNHSNEFMRRESLPILDSVSTELLVALAESSYEETVRMMTDPDSEAGQSYSAKKSLFDQTKDMYSLPDEEFLSAENVGITEPKSISIVRTANMAIFANTVFGGKGVGFYGLNDNFLEIFVPEGGDLEEELGILLLGLKTQVYISVMASDSPEEKMKLLDYLFPDDFGARLLERHHSDKELALLKEMTLSESKFLTELAKRRALLLNMDTEPDTILKLSTEYSWEGYLQLFAEFLHKKYQAILPSRSRTSQYPYLSQGNGNKMQQIGTSNGDHDLKSSITTQEIESEADRAVREALERMESKVFSSHDGFPSQDMILYQQNGHPQHAHNGFKAPYHVSQSAPTSILYEQARQASVNKSAPHSRRPGLPSQRKPWTSEEENALMAGLDQVRGPHWSQILALYGPNGSISEILKGRNQVQLKDKARNLKLFFLKSNIEVPYYLQSVTGELKTRAPSLAQRKEAEERARLANGVAQAPQYQYQQQHHSPYGARQPPYNQQAPPQQPSQQPPQSRMERGNSGQGVEILDPVGPTAPAAASHQQTLVAQQSSEPATQTQEKAMQAAVQEMSADEHNLAGKLKAENDRHDSVGNASPTTASSVIPT